MTVCCSEGGSYQDEAAKAPRTKDAVGVDGAENGEGIFSGSVGYLTITITITRKIGIS